MKKLFAVLLSCMTVLTASSQKATISPLPQNITWGEEAFQKDTKFYIVGADRADKEAMQLLTANMKENILGVSDKVDTKKFAQLRAKALIIGEAGDKAVNKYKKLIPQRVEGYYLKVTPDEIVVAGRDGSGTFYGVQTLLQILNEQNVMQCEITDYPSVTDRGVIEGFYGNPWSHKDRLRQFDFYGQYKMNTYVFGPKDDPYHRARWREPYPTEEAAQLKELVDAAHRNKVKFVWAIHPAGDIKWCLEDSVNVARKLELMYDLGVRSFAVFFDDVWGEGARGDKQAGLLNYLTDVFVRKHKDVEPLIMCPSQYNKGWSHGDYLNTLGTKMYPEVRIMWTGNSVVDMIEENDMQWINDQIKRKAYIWLNYPVNDYCQSRLLMGKTYGNGLNINDMVSGFCSNPMEYAEASKVSLYSIADYTWNMPAYNSEASWERAMVALMPTCDDAFRIFCENNVDLGPTGHGLRREGESPNFSAENLETLAANFQQLVWAADNLLADEVNHPEMLDEIKPWVQSMRLLGQRGQMCMNMAYDLLNNDSVAFIGHYRAQTQLEQQQKAIISRNYEGSIVKAKPVVSGDVITPWLNENIANLIKLYKKNHTAYGMEYFPVQAIEDGEYFIKVNGEYLTNVQAGAERVGDFPVFQAERDIINPQRQQWVIEQNSKTGRYKIYNKQDGRYINETGAFWFNKDRNPFDAQWHTYLLVKQDGKWSIQNAGSAGKGYWQRSGNRLNNGGTGAFVFEIEKVK
ncbi:MAG: beta-N-acetylglucosaminidase domain-containing protein [Paraprevotella sp.]|nr:beta-N-acetylglucosaminidase domain-containing protein [Paraprevotella sp.]